MSGLVGVVAFADFEGCHIKRAAILFHELVTMAVDLYGRATPVDRLAEYGVIAETASAIDVPVSNGFVTFDYKLIERYRRSDSVSVRTTGVTITCDLMSHLLRQHVEDTRPGVTAVPFLTTLISPHDAAAIRHDVLRVVLKRLPLPTDDTPWEAIRDWRFDSDARSKYLRLLMWLDQAYRRCLNTYEVEHELGAMLADYVAYMAIQHKRFVRSTAELLVVTAAEVLESAIRLKLSDALRRLFDTSKGELAFAEAELQAPGRDVAYIAAAHARFTTPRRLA